MTAVERKSDFKLTIDTPYLALTGELWVVFCEELRENWPCYNSTMLYNNFVPLTGLAWQRCGAGEICLT